MFTLVIKQKITFTLKQTTRRNQLLVLRVQMYKFILTENIKWLKRKKNHSKSEHRFSWVSESDTLLDYVIMCCLYFTIKLYALVVFYLHSDDTVKRKVLYMCNTYETSQGIAMRLCMKPHSFQSSRNKNLIISTRKRMIIMTLSPP